MATEGRILTEPDAAGGNPVRTILQTTQANDEGAPSAKDTQVMVLGDPNTPANMLEVDAAGRGAVVIAGSASTSAPVTGSLTAAAAATVAGTASTTGTVVIDVSAAGNASFHLLATAFVGTVVFEQSFDPAGTAGTWAAVPCIPEDAGSAPMSTLAISTAVAYIRQFTQGMFGPALFRVRCSAFTSGALAVRALAGPGWVEPQPALGPSDRVIGAVSLATALTFTGTAVNTSATANSNTVLLAAAAAGTRHGLVITNAGTGILTIGYGFTTSATLYTYKLDPGEMLEVPAGFAAAAMNGQSTVASQPVTMSIAAP